MAELPKLGSSPVRIAPPSPAFKPPEYSITVGEDKTLQWEPPRDSEALAIALSYHFPLLRTLEDKMQAATKAWLKKRRRKKESETVAEHEKNEGMTMDSMGESSPSHIARKPAPASGSNASSRHRIHKSGLEHPNSSFFQGPKRGSHAALATPPAPSTAGISLKPRTSSRIEIPGTSSWLLETGKEVPQIRKRRAYTEEERREVGRNRGMVCEYHRQRKQKCDPDTCSRNKLSLKQDVSLDPPLPLPNLTQVEKAPSGTTSHRAREAQMTEKTLGKCLFNNCGPQSPCQCASTIGNNSTDAGMSDTRDQSLQVRSSTTQPQIRNDWMDEFISYGTEITNHDIEDGLAGCGYFIPPHHAWPPSPPSQFPLLPSPCSRPAISEAVGDTPDLPSLSGPIDVSQFSEVDYLFGNDNSTMLEEFSTEYDAMLALNQSPRQPSSVGSGRTYHEGSRKTFYSANNIDEGWEPMAKARASPSQRASRIQHCAPSPRVISLDNSHPASITPGLESEFHELSQPSRPDPSLMPYFASLDPSTGCGVWNVPLERSRSTLPRWIRPGGVSAPSLAGVDFEGPDRGQMAKQDAAEEEPSGSRHISRSTSILRSPFYFYSDVDPEQEMVEYGTNVKVGIQQDAKENGEGPQVPKYIRLHSLSHCECSFDRELKGAVGSEGDRDERASVGGKGETSELEIDKLAAQVEGLGL